MIADDRFGDAVVGLACLLAVGAIVAAALDALALSVLLGFLVVPVALYAASAARRSFVVVALACAVIGASVIAFAIYEMISAIRSSR
jgi:hypothetical protein